ncbi:hypothetical protein [Sphingobacterium sp.]|uniref:hypothetical protein n=1 Tax=Sphingobacterium sp. TaxID=341027 RepID=UPI00258C23F9|nr:hypothetical protein [Sphingobacterium sp.]WET70852.1 MAG: hypothetical protein P0Y57_07140 [Sphingobacterium sp.]
MRLIIVLIVFLFVGCGKEGGQGPQGEKGEQGAIGKSGNMLLHGTSNPNNSIGKEGDFYLNLMSGDLFGPKTEIGWGNPFSMKGDKGPPGDAGSAIYYGDSGPDGAIGNIGDYYIDKTNVLIYGPKLPTGWGDPVSLDRNEKLGVSVYFIKADFSSGLDHHNYVSTVDSSFICYSQFYSIPNARGKVIETYWYSQPKNSTEPIISQPWAPLNSESSGLSISFGWNLSLYNVNLSALASGDTQMSVRFYINGRGFSSMPDFSKPSENLYFIVKVSDVKATQALSKNDIKLNRLRRIDPAVIDLFQK